MSPQRRMAILITLGLFMTAGTVFAQYEQTAPPQGANRPLYEIGRIISRETDLSLAEIVLQMRTGRTPAEIIATSGADLQVVSDHIVASLADQINQAVTDGQLTRERADRLLANLPDLVTRALNGESRPGWRGRIRMAVLDLAAVQTGLERREIAQQLRSGKALATILTESGVDPDAFVETAAAELDTRLDQAVSSGRLTRDQADERLSAFRQRLTERLDHTGQPEPAASV